MRAILVLLAALTVVACDKPAEQPAEVPPAEVEPPVEVAKASPAKLMVDGNTVMIGSVLAWELRAAGSLVH